MSDPDRAFDGGTSASAGKVRGVLLRRGVPPEIRERFLRLWDRTEHALSRFAKVTTNPLFCYLDGELVLESKEGLLPNFCCTLLGDPTMGARCRTDGLGRARASAAGPTLCHAGRITWRRGVSLPGIGELVVLFGARPGSTSEARALRASALADLGKSDHYSVEALKADEGDVSPQDGLDARDLALLDSITDGLEALGAAFFVSDAAALVMAHEISVALLATNMHAWLLRQHAGISEANRSAAEAISDGCRLSLYVARNYLSSMSETSYRLAVEQKVEPLPLHEVIDDCVRLVRPMAERKGVKVDFNRDGPLPIVRVVPEELARALYNVLSNAAKYSYRSTSSREWEREIRIRTHWHDPGFRERRIAIVVQNFGLGLLECEVEEATKVGFRGEMARREVPIGAGIGLSEARKIAILHGGRVSVASRKLVPDSDESPYLTTVKLIIKTGEIVHG